MIITATLAGIYQDLISPVRNFLSGPSIEERARATEVDQLLDEAWDRLGGGVDLRSIEHGRKSSAQLESARRKIRDALRLDPESSRGRLILATYHVATGEPEIAEQICREILISEPDTTAAIHLLANILTASSRFSEALLLYKREIELAPREPFGYDGLGHLLAISGRETEAIPYLSRALRMAPQSPGHYQNLALAFFGLRKHAEAEAILRDGLRVEPDNPRTLLNLGAVVASQGRFDEAHKYLSRALEIDRVSLPALANLGMVARRTRQYEQALSFLKSALRLAPEDQEVLLALARTYLGRARAQPPKERTKDLDRAMNIYLHQLQGTNTCGRLLNLEIAYLFYRRGEHRKGIAYLEKARGTGCFETCILNNIGTSYLHLDDEEKAVRYWLRALRQDPEYAEAKMNLEATEHNRAAGPEAIPMLAGAYDTCGALSGI